jgi:hypothetical protein
MFDVMLLPALSAAKGNRVRGDITQADEGHVVTAIREIVQDVGERSFSGAAAATEHAEAGSSSDDAARPPIVIFGCPARDAADCVGLEMLESLLDPARWKLELAAPVTLIGELIERIALQEPALVLIGSIPPGGLAHTRYVCKRLRTRFPELRILVGRWGEQPDAPASERLREAGAFGVTSTLAETRQQLDSLLPIFEHRSSLNDELTVELCANH